MITRRLYLAGGAAAVALVASVALSGPAHADISQCPSNRACAWTNTQYSGAFANWASSATYVGGGMNDQISSSYNERNASTTWYTNSGYGGNPWTQGPYEGGQYAWPAWQADVFSSVWLY